MKIDQGLAGIPSAQFIELPRNQSNERHFVIQEKANLRQVLSWADQQGYYLCDLVMTDERLLVDRTFKVFYILSGNEDEMVILEYFVPDPQRSIYDSVADIFPNAYPLEQEIHDMFGLIARKPDDVASHPGFLLQAEAYPPALYPLRRRRTLQVLQERLQAFSPPDNHATSDHISSGMLTVPVGPIHAGIIEAGHFPFYVGGEVVEDLPLRLGYKHRGIEKLFETHHTLQNGWTLAEKVSGDSSVAHAISYCQAVESLADTVLHPAVYEWRALLLELERMYNHISDLGLVATGMAYEQAAAALATLRELFVTLNQSLSGNRLLRGLNHPGGIHLPEAVNPADLLGDLEVIVEEALVWGKKMIEHQGCRERMLTTGTLTRSEARYATGLVARASGWFEHDFRIRHPSRAASSAAIQKLIRETFTSEENLTARQVPIYLHDLKGDVFARLVVRVAELETSLYLVKEFASQIDAHSKQEYSLFTPMDHLYSRIPEMSMGLGYAEGWRGDVLYVIFKGTGETIARCKVRDPSTFNWQVFPEAVKYKLDETSNKSYDNILADFPLINKSFNLSYAGHDL